MHSVSALVFVVFCLPQPIKAGVIVVTCAVQAAGIKLVGVPQPKPMHGFPPNFQGMFTPRGSRADYVLGGIW